MKELSLFEEQADALADCLDFLINNAPLKTDGSALLIFNAPAGTGKTHTINTLSRILEDCFGETISMVSYTGRAASQLRKSGSPNVSTFHALMYQAELDNDGNLLGFKKKDRNEILDSCGSFFAVDESSMVPFDVYRDIVNLGLPIIFIGDTAQLDPVANETDFNVMKNVDAPLITLETNRRTDEEAKGIYYLSEHLRETNTIPRRKMNGVEFKPKSITRYVDFHKENEYDAILCGTNKTRKYLNQIVRRARGYTSPVPEVGEVVMCLQNSYAMGTPINNGEIFIVDSVFTGSVFSQFNVTNIDTEQKTTIKVHNDYWNEEEPRLTKDERQSTHKFCFGYAMTVFKAQGSTFQRVLYIDEDVSFFTDQQKFRYTAVSRAAKKLTLSL